jgi:hypothetical protein
MRPWVYVIASTAGMVKVGISRAPAARLAALQTGHPFKLTLFRQVERPKGDALRVEQTAHRILRAHRQHGTEWFKVTPEEAAKAVETACEASEAREAAKIPRRIRYYGDDPKEAEEWVKENPGQLAREIRKWSNLP